MDRVSAGRRQDYTCSQSGQHFRAVEVHDPVSVRVVLFREFGFCPFGDKISQYLGFNGSTWFICNVKWEELNGSFVNLARGIAVVYYVVEWHFGGHRNRTLLKVVS